jgi:hypothetical protein
MKTTQAILFSIVLLFMPAYAFASSPGYMRISLIEGDVQIRTSDSGDWGPASINGPLAEGDQVWTPRGSRVELQLNNGTYIRLDQNSALQILSEDSDSSQFYLTQGRVYINFNPPRGSVIQFDTPDASTRAFNRAIFRIDIPDRYTDVTVYKGYVESENAVGMTRINAGEMLSLGRNTNGEVASVGPPDEWENWNRSRDNRIYARRGAGYSYLPAELRTYSSDFDDYGRWVNVPDYGYCWTPTVFVGVNWAPYRSGRWIWRHGDYVWVPFEPWGWAPCHYGRWAFVARIGWCWVPPAAGAVYWGPGYVGWVRTPNYVAWVPLAPGETYYGRGYYGPHSVNITKANINQIHITNVYKNVYANNGVTVVSRNTFNTASPAVVNVNRNTIQRQIFTRNNISLGAPAIRPTRASFFASSKPIPPSRLPPQSVRNIKVRELKQSHPLVRAPGRSALNPATAAAPLPVTTVARPRTPGREQPALRKLQPPSKGKPGIQGGQGFRVESPKVQPTERAKPIAPVRPLPGGERPRVQPEKRERPAIPAAPQPRVERPKVQPLQGTKPTPSARPLQGIEKPRFQPEKREKPVIPVGPQPRMERPKVQPLERAKPSQPVVPLQGSERPRFQPEKREKPLIPAAPQPRVDKPQTHPTERAKPAPPAIPGPVGEKPRVRPEKKESPEKPVFPGQGGGKMPGEPAQVR